MARFICVTASLIILVLVRVQSCQLPDLKIHMEFAAGNTTFCTSGSDLPQGEQCSVVCAPGFSQDQANHVGFLCEAEATNVTVDLPRCSECAHGQYQQNAGSVFCNECPAHSSTSKTGSASFEQCHCNDGYQGDINSPTAICLGRPCTGLPAALEATKRQLMLVSDSNMEHPRHYLSTVQLACKDQSRHVLGDSTWTCDNATGIYLAVHDPTTKATDVSCSEPSTIPHCPCTHSAALRSMADGLWLWSSPSNATGAQALVTCQKRVMARYLSWPSASQYCTVSAHQSCFSS